MAVKSSSGFITEEKPQSITQQASDSGLGTPESPMGAKTAGANPDQAKMAGTPAQQDSAQQVRQAREDTKTLEEAKRYEQKPQVDQYAQAKEKAASLAELGPVKSRVQSLIEQKMADVSSTTAELSANQAKIDALPEEQRAAAQTALNDYLSNPTEENIQKFYDVVGKAELEAGGISSYLVGDEEAIAGLAQGQLGGQVTLDQLDLGQLGVDMAELESQLGLQPGEAAGMSLDQLDQAIDAIESQELNQVESIRAQLADPSLPPQQRQQLLQQLSSLGAAGMTGLEEQINQLDEQIQAADTMEIGGVTMSLEEALGDDGISATIKNAVVDPEYLNQLKDVPGYENLGDWIETNKSLLEGLVGEVEDTATDFLEVQQQYGDVKESLGADGAELLKDLFPNIDWDKTSVLSGNMTQILDKIQGNNVYQYLTQNEEFATRAKNDPDYLSDLKVLSTNGFDVEQMGDVMETMENEIKSDTLASSLFGDELPENLEEWEATKANLAELEDMDPAIKSGATSLVKDGIIDFEDLKDINDSDFGTEILEDIHSNITATKQWERDLGMAEDPISFIKENIFKDKNFSNVDANFVINYGPKEAADAVKAIFDLDGDGEITNEEMQSEEVIERAKAHRGLGASVDDMKSKQGTWDVTQGDVVGVTSDFFEATVTPQLQTKIEERRDVIANKREKVETGLANVLENSGLIQAEYEALKGSMPQLKELAALKKKVERLPSAAQSDGMKIAGTTYFPTETAEATKVRNEYNRMIDKIAEETGVDREKIKGIQPHFVSSVKRNQDKIDFYNQKDQELNNTFDTLTDMGEEELLDLFEKWT